MWLCLGFENQIQNLVPLQFNSWSDKNAKYTFP